MPKESTIQKNILNFLNRQPNTRARNVHGGLHSGRGEPDIDCVMNGRSIKIEVKTTVGVVSPVQESIMRKWKKAGAIVFVAVSVDEVKEKLMKEGVLSCDNGSNTKAANGQK